MAILLTGGAGYIGSHTYIELMRAGLEPVIVDNFCNSQPEVLRRLETLTGRPVICHVADVCDKRALSAIFEQHAFEAVIHFAGLKAVGESVGIPIRYYRNNIDSTLTLLEVMAEHGVRRIVFSSSATVYGVTGTMPLVAAA